MSKYQEILKEAKQNRSYAQILQSEKIQQRIYRFREMEAAVERQKFGRKTHCMRSVVFKFLNEKLPDVRTLVDD